MELCASLWGATISYGLKTTILNAQTFRKSPPAPKVLAAYETTPIPFGLHDSDDPAIWWNPDEPGQSLILGTSKFEPDRKTHHHNLEGYGGLGVYALDGRETRFLPGDRLNNIEVLNDRCDSKGCTGELALASNRTINGITIFRVSSSRVSVLANIPLIDETNDAIKVYGLCATKSQGQTLALVTTKKGIAYLFEVRNLPDGKDWINPPITALLIKTIDLSALITPAQDQTMQTLVEKEARAEGELQDLEKKLQDRFALEGCVYDGHRKRWLVGMEKFGIWIVPQESKGSQKLDEAPTPLLTVQGSWTDIGQWGQNPGTDPIADDLEGLEVFTYNNKDYMLFSSQGISEFGLYDLSFQRYLGNFSISLNDKDPVTQTDGLAVKSAPMGPLFPDGILVVHDDTNEASDATYSYQSNVSGEKSLERANYKIVDLNSVMRLFPSEDPETIHLD